MDLKTCLSTLISEKIDQFSDKSAYVFQSDDVILTRTFRQLSDEQEIVSSALDGLPKGACVGLYLENGIYIPTIIYSLLRRQLCFIFIDPSRSADENAKIITDLRVHSILTTDCTKDFPFSRTTLNKNIFRVLGCNLQLIRCQSNNFDNIFDYENICYIMQTSGTTGKRKYVRVTYDCINSNINSLRKKFRITEKDVIYFGTPLTFDPCMVELFLALTSGASLVGTSTAIRERPSALLKTLFRNDCNKLPSTTVMQMCPSVCLRWSDVDLEYIFNRSELRILALGGEPFPEQILQLKRRSELKLFNLYGITEVSCWASVGEVVDEVTLGEVLDDTVLEVRDKQGRKMCSGEGLLFIGTHFRICLINDEQPENIKTPLYRSSGDLVRIDNNVLKYLGRSDNSVKRFGHRINLNQLEQYVYSSTGLTNKCVWLPDLCKVAIFIGIKHFHKEKDKIVDKIRVKLLKNLRSYEFPDHIDLLTELPLTVNGKVDTGQLEILTRKYFTEKLTSTFSELWCRYLGLSPEQAEQNKICTFTELGGSSILKLQIISELRMSTNMNLNGNSVNALMDGTYEDGCKYLKVLEVEQLNSESADSKGVFTVVWKYNLYACIDTAVTLIINKHYKYVAIGNFANIFIILNSSDGKEISHAWLPHHIENASSVSLNQNIIHVGCFDGCMYALDIETCKVVWQFPTGDQIKNTGCLSIGKTALVFGSYDKHLYCVNVEDGCLIWKQHLNEPITSNPVNLLGKIIVAGLHGKIVWLEEKNGKVLFTFKAKNPIFVPPETTNGLIVFLDVGGFFYCFNCENMKLQWTYETASSLKLFSSFLIHKNFIIFGTQETAINILEFGKEQCTLRHSLRVNHDIRAKPALLENESGEHFLFVTLEGVILLYRHTEENFLSLVDSMALGGPCFATPVVHDNELYIGCRDNCLYLIKVAV